MQCQARLLAAVRRCLGSYALAAPALARRPAARASLRRTPVQIRVSSGEVSWEVSLRHAHLDFLHVDKRSTPFLAAPQRRG